MTANLTVDMLAILAAIPIAAAGGEAFLRGVLGVAKQLRIPRLLVATTLVAFATSSPELTVSTVAALAGQPEIGLGDALGSNVVNLALVLGLALMFGDLPAVFVDYRREFWLALLVPVLTLVLMIDGVFARHEGALLLTLLVLWLGFVARQALDYRRITAGQAEEPTRPWLTLLLLVVGLAALVLAGRLFVTGASGVAQALGVGSYVIGAILVAIGTSLPELATVLVARWRGQDEVGLGALLGSNLFNGLAVVGVASMIHPIWVPFTAVAPALVLGVLTVLLLLPRRGLLTRGRGALLLAAYAVFVATTFAA